MNTGNILVRQWLVTKYPKIVDSYEQFDDANPFRTIVLVGALDTDDMEIFESGKITVVVTYKNCYDKFDGTSVKVSFGLGSFVAVNAIVGLPYLTDWKVILYFDGSKAHSKAMQISFPLSLKEASTVLQNLIDVSPYGFVWPKNQTSLSKSFIINQECTALGITDSSCHNVVEIISNTIATVDGVSNTSILTRLNLTLSITVSTVTDIPH